MFVLYKPATQEYYTGRLKPPLETLRIEEARLFKKAPRADLVQAGWVIKEVEIQRKEILDAVRKSLLQHNVYGLR